MRSVRRRQCDADRLNMAKKLSMLLHKPREKPDSLKTLTASIEQTTADNFRKLEELRSFQKDGEMLDHELGKLQMVYDAQMDLQIYYKKVLEWTPKMIRLFKISVPNVISEGKEKEYLPYDAPAFLKDALEEWRNRVAKSKVGEAIKIAVQRNLTAQKRYTKLKAKVAALERELSYLNDIDSGKIEPDFGSILRMRGQLGQVWADRQCRCQRNKRVVCKDQLRRRVREDTTLIRFLSIFYCAYDLLIQFAAFSPSTFRHIVAEQKFLNEKYADQPSSEASSSQRGTAKSAS